MTNFVISQKQFILDSIKTLNNLEHFANGAWRESNTPQDRLLANIVSQQANTLSSTLSLLLDQAITREAL